MRRGSNAFDVVPSFLVGLRSRLDYATKLRSDV